MNVILLVFIQIAIIGMAVIILFFSDRSVVYRVISLLTLLPMAVLEVPHLLFPDPTDLIDIFTHFTAGIAIFVTASNLKALARVNREWIALIIGIAAILVSEAVLTAIGGSITLDSLEDIIWNSVGSVAALPLYWVFGKSVDNGIDGSPSNCCKC